MPGKNFINTLVQHSSLRAARGNVQCTFSDFVFCTSLTDCLFRLRTVSYPRPRNEARFERRILRPKKKARAMMASGKAAKRGLWNQDFRSGASGRLMPYGQGGPSGEGHLRPEMVSLPRASRAQRDIMRFETRSVSFLNSVNTLWYIKPPRSGSGVPRRRGPCPPGRIRFRRRGRPR